jgi:hypothetical protein
MTIIKKLLLLFTLFIFFFILWRLLIIRINLKKEFNKESFSVLNMFSSSQDKEMNNNISPLTKLTINDANKGILDLPLKELCIKASYNSANSGSYISLNMLQYVINRGVRYLDFEVFFIQSDNAKKTMKPVVATSTDPDFIAFSSENNLLLDDVLSYAVSNAFSSPCPNMNDPLFINLRIKSNNRDVYKAVAASIDSTIKQKIYSDPNNIIFTDASIGDIANKAITITKDTKFSDIKGSVIISIDKTLFPNYTNFTNCDIGKQKCYDLTNYTNIECGSENMNLTLYSLISPQKLLQINDDNRTTNVKTITVVNPDSTFLINKANTNPKYSDFIIKYGCQIVPYRFYQNDSSLEDYEKFFNIHNSAFVPLASAISYYVKQYA